MPMIGIMSDSHDNCDAIRQAVCLFNELKCRIVVHAGDFVAPFAAKELESLKGLVKAVYGNCDGEKKGLEETFSSIGTIREAPFCFSYLGVEFLVTHTHFSLNSYIRSGKYDVIIYGHTHKPLIQREGRTLVINPGETGGWLSGKGTVVLLDSETLEVEIRFLDV